MTSFDARDDANELNFDYKSTVDELQRQLDVSYRREAQLDAEIKDVLRRNADLPKHLNVVLSRMKTRLALTESDASQLSSLLSLTSVLAENVSGKVRDLDLSKTRVVDCLQRVEDALDLRFCTEGVRSSMANEDYEQAAGHVHRFLMLDSAVLGLGATEKAPGDDDEGKVSSESLEQQFSVMKEAENELKRIVGVRFDEALRDGDVASMERFFKLFPLLNQHKIGLEKFGSYLKTKIAETSEKNYKIMMAGGQDDARVNVLYADTLTLLLEGVARILEIHQPLIETYYGPDRLLTLAEILQEQCDIEADQILDQFVKIRQYNGKGKLIETYSRQSSKYAQLEKLDPAELDLLLSEVTVLQTRCELYFKFLRRRIAPNLQTNSSETENEAAKEAKREKTKRLEALIRGCRLSRRMQELIGKYIAMEEYFMRETTLKAVDLDVKEDGQSLTSSMVDDVFFVIRKCVRRTLSSSNVDCVCAMLNNACALLETDYLQLIQNRLRAGYPAVGSFAEAYTAAAAAYVSVVQQGKIPVTGGDSAEKARDEFLTALNNADSSADCVKTLKDSLQNEIYKYVGGKLADQDAAKLDTCLGQTVDVSKKFRDVARQGLEQLVAAAAKPRLKVFAEHFLDHTHAPTDAEFNDFEANDPFVEQFVTGLDSLLANFKQCLTETNFQAFVEFTSSETSKQLEKIVFKCTFNRLGGLMFDKQLRELNAYLTSIGGWAVREKFARLTQIASILNVDNVNEAKEYYQSATISWRLSPVEFRKVLAVRVDLPGEEIRKLKI